VTIRLALAAALVVRGASAAADPAPPPDAAPASDPASDDDPPLASAASSRLERAELDERPRARTVDLLRHLPGLYPVLVDGGGRAEAYLTRGFDAGSGLDLEVLVDGVPVNAAGAGTGHGYADTQFVIPDSVASVALNLGPYAARYGNFASAGALELRTLDEVPGGGAVLRLSSGTDLRGGLAGHARRLTYRVSGMASPALATSHAIVAVEVALGDGPFVHPLTMQRGSALAKWTYPFSGGTFQIAATVFSGRANDSGELPEADVEAHRVDRFGALDATLGDTAMRASLSAGVTTHDAAGGSWHLGAYVVAASQRLYANPTVFLFDPERGDQTEEVDDRTQLGVTGVYQRAHRLFGLDGRLRLGVQARADHDRAELWHDAQRVRLDTCFAAANPCLRAQTRVNDLAVYAEDVVHPHAAVTVTAGLRLDQVTWDGADTAPGAPGAGDPASGNAARARLGPKLGAAVEVLPGLEVSALAGGGFRTSDTRAVIATDAVRGVPRIWAAELGARLHADERLSAAIAAYVAWQDAEVRWDATQRSLEPVDRTRRTGIDARVALAPLPWLSLDGNLGLARGVRDPGSAQAALPGVPRIHGGAGVTARRDTSFVTLRGVGLGARLLAAEPELKSPAQLVLSLAAGTRWRGLELGLSLDNLLDTAWREDQRALQLRSTRTADPITDVVFAPGAPFTVFLTVGYHG